MIRNKPLKIPYEEFCRYYSVTKDKLPAYDKFEDEEDECGYSDCFEYEQYSERDD